MSKGADKDLDFLIDNEIDDKWSITNLMLQCVCKICTMHKEVSYENPDEATLKLAEIYHKHYKTKVKKLLKSVINKTEFWGRWMNEN